MSISSVTKEISGWGNYPVQQCHIFQPDSTSSISEILQHAGQPNYISYGLGRSYGDTPLNKSGGVIMSAQLNRFIHFDEETGMLECEAGVSLEEIIEYFLPRGWFLPVTPGTKFVTIGGAIANDVHGKNHHKNGCISEFIPDFRIMIASGEIIHCSREHHEQLFWATIGGIGLTGIIISARLRLIRVQSSYMKVYYQKASNLEQALSLFSEGDHLYPYSVAWIDCLATGRSLGRSVLMRGHHATASESPQQGNPLSVKLGRKLNVPFDLPSITLNPLTVQLFNKLYYSSYKNNHTKLVSIDSYFYPLDAISNWNRMYGHKGFVQYQAVFPTEHSLEGLTRMLELISESGRSSFLAVLKSSGEQNKGLLSFPMKGYTLALDIPVKDNSLIPFLHQLDELVIRNKGRVYLGKDATITPHTFRTMYQHTLDEFTAIKRQVDPTNCFSSSMARRLGIMEDIL